MAPIPLSQDARVTRVEGKMANLEDRMDALNTKIDVSIEAVRGDIKRVLERVDSLGAEMGREFATVRKNIADRQLMSSVLKDHGMLPVLGERRTIAAAGPGCFGRAEQRGITRTGGDKRATSEAGAESA